MASSQDDKRAQFRDSLKVNTNNTQNKSNKQGQFSSNNANSSSNGNTGDTPTRGRSQGGGRGNER